LACNCFAEIFLQQVKYPIALIYFSWWSNLNGIELKYRDAGSDWNRSESMVCKMLLDSRTLISSCVLTTLSKYPVAVTNIASVNFEVALSKTSTHSYTYLVQHWSAQAWYLSHLYQLNSSKTIFALPVLPPWNSDYE